ncbi:hypothetical protein L1887_26662 [Cichorium endivia]|nr:hypothetical protein L1887_26662 [Cichorium endivia]
MTMRITHLVPLLASAKRTPSSPPSPTAPAPGYSRNNNNQRNGGISSVRSRRTIIKVFVRNTDFLTHGSGKVLPS